MDCGSCASALPERQRAELVKCRFGRQEGTKMGYCTVNEVLQMMKAEMQNVILADNDVEDEEERQVLIKSLASRAIEDAEAEINGYLSSRYTVPFASPPAILNKFSKDIAAYNMVSRIGIDEQDRDKTFLTRYNAAIKFLMAVAEGKIELGIKNPAQAAKNNFQMQSSGRIFSRNSLKGW